MSEETNKGVVRRYFKEAIDGGDRSVMGELFVDGAKGHFPGRDTRVALDQPPPDMADRHFATTLHNLLADGDFVVARLTHRVSYEKNVRFDTRVGPVDVGGKSVTWDALVLFHVSGGKVDEWWIHRDELDVLSQIGAIKVATV